MSRSWTTRPRRRDEPEDAYFFTDRQTFEGHAGNGGFLEHAEFLGELYGTPVPDPHPGLDLLLEIDLQGAAQIKEKFPDAVVVLLVPPSTEVQAQRLRLRGDEEESVTRRIEKGREEMESGAVLADHTVVNDEVDRALLEVAGILESHRKTRGGA